jgi:hypothetical protein
MVDLSITDLDIKGLDLVAAEYQVYGTEKS